MIKWRHHHQSIHSMDFECNLYYNSNKISCDAKYVHPKNTYRYFKHESMYVYTFYISWPFKTWLKQALLFYEDIRLLRNMLISHYFSHFAYLIIESKESELWTLFSTINLFVKKCCLLIWDKGIYDIKKVRFSLKRKS